MSASDRIELDGLGALRLLSAGQALRMPPGAYGVTHEQARQIIEGLLGYCPAGTPDTGKMDAVLEWCGLSEAIS
jgi:hypothetical protein